MGRLKEWFGQLVQQLPSQDVEARVEVDNWLTAGNNLIVEAGAQDHQLFLRMNGSDWPLRSGTYALVTSQGRRLLLSTHWDEVDDWAVYVGTETVDQHDTPPVWDVKFRIVPFHRVRDPLVIVALEDGEFLTDIEEIA